MNNKNNKDAVNTSRRDLIKGLTTAAVVSAVAAGTSTTAVAQEEAVVKPEKQGEGYRETQHIRDYYDSL
ncbi:twin-arginine translocation signal domain-containing protein [uncultured Vibrio sp.]|uniref:twin-arginine translocation signal domain-containing protein n=1 Tax=uncultured Vibrio sp. TaxID=114054 RepID=UPI000912F498|nr:twin-arginine translocation signal domain-containing protein [uncultured Vibrio sp.]OIQ26332.1 MAG: transcriptional initiation protein Tat [Vibrio sp. MedPE-SWchi]